MVIDADIIPALVELAKEVSYSLNIYNVSYSKYIINCSHKRQLGSLPQEYYIGKNVEFGCCGMQGRNKGTP